MSSTPPPTGPPKPIGPGNHDKAWNDPPLFSVDVNTRSGGTRPKLTGRVAFPINGPTQTATLSGSAPPMGPPTHTHMQAMPGTANNFTLPPPLINNANSGVNSAADSAPPLPIDNSTGSLQGPNIFIPN